MILTRQQIAERQARLAVANKTHACSCVVKMTIRLDSLNVTTECTEITFCELHDPQHYLDTIEAAWQEAFKLGHRDFL